MPTLDGIGKDAVIRHHKEVPFRPAWFLWRIPCFFSESAWFLNLE